MPTPSLRPRPAKYSSHSSTPAGPIIQHGFGLCLHSWDLGSVGPPQTISAPGDPTRISLAPAKTLALCWSPGGMGSKGERPESRLSHLGCSPHCTSHNWHLLFPQVSDESLPDHSALMSAPHAHPPSSTPQLSHTALPTIQCWTCICTFTSGLSFLLYCEGQDLVCFIHRCVPHNLAPQHRIWCTVGPQYCY